MRMPLRLGDGADLTAPRGAAPRVGARYDADAFGRMSEATARFLGTGRFLAGQSVLVLERNDTLGGATASKAIFAGLDARLMQHRRDGAFDEQFFVAEHQMQSRCRGHPTIVPWAADAT